MRHKPQSKHRLTQYVVVRMARCCNPVVA